MSISAKIIADSVSSTGIRMTTFELEYPRFILAEVNTHRMLSKNSASSRAIPMKAMHEHIKTDPAMPVFWGKNQAGMQAKEELCPEDIEKAKTIWLRLRDQMIAGATELFDLGLHKQISNRTTETCMTMKSVVSGTSWANLLYLRNHVDAQPEFFELAKLIQYQMDFSNPPQVLRFGQWHLPYIDTRTHLDGSIQYFVGDVEVPLDIAIKVSASCCAQVSYRKLDDSIEKAIDIYEKLINSTPAHMSPVEHQATPMPLSTEPWNPHSWADGITHVRKNGSLWSGNLEGWIQHRQRLPNEAKWN